MKETPEEHFGIFWIKKATFPRYDKGEGSPASIAGGDKRYAAYVSFLEGIKFASENIEPENYVRKYTTITVPVLRAYKGSEDRAVDGMVKEENFRLIVKFAHAVTREEIGRIFGRVEFKGIVRSIHGVEQTEKFTEIHITAWSF